MQFDLIEDALRVDSEAIIEKFALNTFPDSSASVEATVSYPTYNNSLWHKLQYNSLGQVISHTIRTPPEETPEETNVLSVDNALHKPSLFFASDYRQG